MFNQAPGLPEVDDEFFCGFIRAVNIEPGVVLVQIFYLPYGQAGRHWKRVLGNPEVTKAKYGSIYIDRFGIKERRKWNLWEFRGDYRGVPEINLDECPGAMFITENTNLSHVEHICAVDNQKLGRDLGNVLTSFTQGSPDEYWEVRFEFLDRWDHEIPTSKSHSDYALKKMPRGMNPGLRPSSRPPPSWVIENKRRRMAIQED